jgi:hypothetical protein
MPLQVPLPGAWDAEEIRTTTVAVTGTTITDAFTGFAPLISSTYMVEAWLPHIATATTAGLQHGIDGANTSISEFNVAMTAPTAAGATSFVNPATWGALAGSTGGLTTGMLALVWAVFRTNTTPPASNVRIRFRADAAGETQTIRIGATMRWRKIG